MLYIPNNFLLDGVITLVMRNATFPSMLEHSIFIFSFLTLPLFDSSLDVFFFLLSLFSFSSLIIL